MRALTEEFQEADADGNAELDFEEWKSMLPAATLRTRSDEQLRETYARCNCCHSSELRL